MIRPGAAPARPHHQGGFNRTLALCLVTIVLVLHSRSVAAQMFQAQAGTSSLYEATGGTLLVRSRDQEVRLAVGTIRGELRFGTLLRKRLRGYTFGFGDDAVDLRLPTDLSSGTRYIPSRGASLSFERRNTQVFALVGTTSASFGAPYLQAADWGRPLGVLLLDKQLNPSVKLFSRTLIAKRGTFINGIAWKPHPALEIDGAAGMAAGRRYTASSATLRHRWLRAEAGYVDTATEFRSATLDSSASADIVRENVEVTLAPGQQWSIHVARRHLVLPHHIEKARTGVAVNHLAATLNVAAIRVGAGVFETRGGDIDNIGTSVNVGRTIGDRTDFSMSYFGSRTAEGRVSNSVVATVRQAINPRLSLAGFATRSDGQTTLKFGGEFLSNLLTVGIDYHTVYAPFHRESPFVQGLGVNATVQPFGSLRLQFGTVVTPTGDVRYSVSGGHSFHRSSSPSARSAGFRLAKYLVRGQVSDEAGKAVAGAVLRINDDVVLTDADGRFFARTSKPRALSLTVVTNEFRGPARFTVVSAPAQLIPATDDKVRDVSIVVSRQPPPVQ